MCPPSRHVLHGAPGHVRGAHQVDAERVLPAALPLLVGRLGDRVRLEDPRVVDEHVEAAERRGGGVDHLPHRLGVGEVGADDHVPLPRQPGGDLLGALAARAVVHRDAVAARGERARDRRADAARRAGDEDRAAHGGDGTRPMLVGDEALRLLGNVPHPAPGRPPVRERLPRAARGRPRAGGREVLRARAPARRARQPHLRPRRPRSGSPAGRPCRCSSSTTAPRCSTPSGSWSGRERTPRPHDPLRLRDLRDPVLRLRGAAAELPDLRGRAPVRARERAALDDARGAARRPRQPHRRPRAS